jgi:hypothetical protein
MPGRMFYVNRIVPVIIIGLLLTRLLSGYPYFTFQKSYFIFIYTLFFCFYFICSGFLFGNPFFSFKLFYRKHATRRNLAILSLAIAVLIYLVYYGIVAVGKRYTFWVLDYYNLASLTASYQTFGLIKRGLIPSIVNCLSADFNVQLGWTRIIGIMVFIGGLTAVGFSKQYNLFSRRLFLIVFLLSPIGIFYQSIFPDGQYDQVMIGILFFSVSVYKKASALIFDLAGLLVHEAYLFLRLPFLLFEMIYFLKNRQKQKSIKAIQILTVASISIGFMIMSSNLVRRDRSELESNYFRLYPHLPTHNLNNLQAFDPMAKDATFAFQMSRMATYYKRTDFITYLIPMSVCLVVVGLLTFLYSDQVGKQKKMDIFFSIASFLSPLLLCFIGLDYGRWLNFAFISWACYYILLRQKLFPACSYSANYLFGVLLCAMIFYPTGIYQHPLTSLFFK